MALKKDIKFLGVFALATGSMISSGIFILPSLAFNYSGPAIFIAYLLSGILALLGVQSIIELSTAMPKAGGDYFFINKALGPIIGTISGILGWLSISFKSAFAIYGISQLLYGYFNIPILLSGLVLILLFLTVNLIGVKETIILQILMVFFLLGIILFFIISSFPVINYSHFDNMFAKGINSIFITSSLIFISFGGLLKVANISEEVKNPKRNIPLGMIVSIIVVTILYSLIVFITTGVLDPKLFGSLSNPIAIAARKSSGEIGFILVTIAAMLAFITTANAGILAASRYPLSLSRDGLIPPIFKKMNKKKTIPIISIFITSLVILLSLAFPLKHIVKVASTIILSTYVLTNLAVIVLRESNLANYKPSYKSPFYPYLQLASIIVFGYFIIDMGSESVSLAFGFIVVCFLIYFFYGRKYYSGSYAILHLIKRMADSRLTEGLLEEELREIIIDRDHIETSQFTELVKRSLVLDLNSPMRFDSLLSLCIGEIAKSSNNELSEKEIYNLFLQQEKDFNCVISPLVAIPHITTAKDSPEFLVIVRNKAGVEFSTSKNKAKAIFLIGVAQNKRKLHLNILKEIAKALTKPDFEEKWLNANNKEELKNIFILG